MTDYLITHQWQALGLIVICGAVASYCFNKVINKLFK